MDRTLAIAAFASALLFAAAPLLTPGFGGFDPDQFPVPQRDPPVQPAGWAFGIWGVIYAWLVLGTGYGAFRGPRDPGWRRALPWLIASLLPGAAWLWVAQVSPLGSLVLIWWMLITAIVALLRAGQADRAWLAAPLGLYAGWLAAASNVALALNLAGFGILGATPAALLGLALAIALGAWVLARRLSPSFAAGLGWALVGVIAANLSPLQPLVAGLAALGLVGLALLTYRQAAG